MHVTRRSRRMRLAKTIASILITLSIMTAIFLFSAQNSGESGSLSDAVARIIASLFVPGFDTMDDARQLWWVSTLGWPVRKTAHATEYACLAVSLVMSCWQVHALHHELRGGGGASRDALVRVGVVAFAIAVLYAASDELHQLFVDGRAGQLQDVLVDASGAAVGCLVAAFVAYRFLGARMRAKTGK